MAAALATIGMLALPTAANAQGLLLDGTPLNVFADGLGALQVRVDGVAAGLFYDPTENPGHAGLEIKEGDTIYPLQAGFDTAIGRIGAEPMQLLENAPGSRTLRSVYRVGPNLSVSESITYVDGSSQFEVRYGILNVSAAPVTIKAGALADLYVGSNDNGNGVISNLAPRFVGGRDEASGLVYGLQEITPWSAFQEGDFEIVFDSFAGGGLNNTVDSSAPDNGVGVEWVLSNIQPGETRNVDVRWLLAAPAPPGTVSPSPPEDEWPLVAQGGVLPPPVVGKTVNAKVRSGKVRVKVPGGKGWIDLDEAVQVPVGTIFDTLRGKITLTSASDGSGGTQSALFYSGIFKVSQTRGKTPITELTLADVKPSCSKAKLASASAAKKKARKLWGDGKGKFRTVGSQSSATVRGTKWMVMDTCAGTVTRVARGSVTVRDFVRRKTVIVKAGKQYLARRR